MSDRATPPSSFPLTSPHFLPNSSCSGVMPPPYSLSHSSSLLPPPLILPNSFCSGVALLPAVGGAACTLGEAHLHSDQRTDPLLAGPGLSSSHPYLTQGGPHTLITPFITPFPPPFENKHHLRLFMYPSFSPFPLSLPLLPSLGHLPQLLPPAHL